MKRLILVLLLAGLVLTLTGCKEPAETIPTTTATPPAVTTTAGCVHQYTDANCTTAKTCALCGYVRGSALGHDYMGGSCSRCGQVDASFVALTEGTWSLDALSENGSVLEYITLVFDANGKVKLTVREYGRLADIPEDEREGYMLDEANWYDYSGEIYYYTRETRAQTFAYVVDGNAVTCSFTVDDELLASLILERTAGNRLTVTFLDGALTFTYPQVGDIFATN